MPQSPQPEGIDKSTYLSPAPSSLWNDPNFLNSLQTTPDALADNPVLMAEIFNILNKLTTDNTVVALHSIGQGDSALAFAMAQRVLMAQMQSLIRWSQIQTLGSFAKTSQDQLMFKAIVHCIAGNLNEPRPIETCVTKAGTDPVTNLLGVTPGSILAQYIEKTKLPWVYTYVGDLRAKDQRIRRIFCKPQPNPPDECPVDGAYYEYKNLSERFDEVSTEIQGLIQTTADCDMSPIPTTIQWTTALPTSTAIEIDRSSFLYAFGNPDTCPKLKKALTAAALAREVGYVAMLLSTAESDAGAREEEREGIRLMREDLERRFTYWKQAFETYFMSYEAFVQSVRAHYSAERTATAAYFHSVQ
ncbi:MAG: hypothetical protein HYY13_07020 [Nitrospirae bacterium]|nr:hypothetical protein [Nitrospirota bacterium]